ncbi:MAG TPA: V-type ATP synthase subunit K [Candidatus Omnitrophota bacterium]|nr:V-type ATP synthase subunit K [Candidatus Omnitrophota bacterium]
MDATVLAQLKDLGISAAVALAAVGSGLGAGYAGMAAVGAWKKCYAQGKAAPFLLLAFVGAPLTQTIYGFLLLLTLRGLVAQGVYAWGFGIFGGLALGVSAMMQGKAAASACDALAETGKGFTNYMIVLGIIETVALFVMVFFMISANAIAP